MCVGGDRCVGVPISLCVYVCEEAEGHRQDVRGGRGADKTSKAKLTPPH